MSFTRLLIFAAWFCAAPLLVQAQTDALAQGCASGAPDVICLDLGASFRPVLAQSINSRMQRLEQGPATEIGPRNPRQPLGVSTQIGHRTPASQALSRVSQLRQKEAPSARHYYGQER